MGKWRIKYIKSEFETISGRKFMKQKGYKVLKICVENGKVLYDIAVFGENSLVIEDFQLCENVYEKVTKEEKTQIEEEYGKELLHNFINDMLIIQ